jgi:hypothetical protein
MRRRESAVIQDGTRVRLTAGGHSSPREGVCVVELASLIAQEEFSDRPQCVCPVIAAFLRGWNDRAPYAERQRLSPHAQRIVGSRASSRVTRERRDICLRWAGADLGDGVVRRLWNGAATRVRIAVFCGLGAALRPNEGAGDYAARVAMARGDAGGAFELLGALLAAGEQQEAPGPRLISANGNGYVPSNGNGYAHSNGNGYVPSNGNGYAPSNGNGRPHRNRDAPPAAEGSGAALNGGGERRARISASD